MKRFTGVLAAMLAAATLIGTATIAKADPKVFSGSVALTQGWADPFNSNLRPTSMVGFLTLKITPANLNGVNLQIDVRHPFSDDTLHYWAGKREFKATLNVPFKKSPLSFFATYTRAYAFKQNDFTVAGLRYSF